MSTYTYHQDPGHGWLAVPVAELRQLGILSRITPYSYVSRDRKTSYLEEDCDMSTFIRAKEATGHSVQLQSTYHEDDAFIRRLPGFPAAARHLRS